MVRAFITLFLIQNIRFLVCCGNEDNSPVWEFQLLGGSAGSAALGSNGLLYFGSTLSADKYFYAVEASSGLLIWSYLCADNSGDIKSPRVGSNGIVYAATSSHGVYAFDAISGALQWNVYDSNYMNGLTGQTFDSGTDTLYLVGDKGISAVNSSGDALWMAKANTNAGSAAPVLGSNGVLYSQFNGTIEGRAVVDGVLMWSVPWMYTSEAQHSVNNVNDVFITINLSNDYFVYRLNGNTGSVEWQVPLYYAFSTAVDDSLGVVYVNEWGGNGHLTSLKQSTGEAIWSYKLPYQDIMISVPFVSLDGVIYFGTDQVRMNAVNSDGHALWNSGQEAFDSPLFDQVLLAANDEMVYLGGDGDNMSAFDIVNYVTLSPTMAPTEYECASSCPLSCPNGYVPDTAWEKNGCTVFCMEEPVNGQCGVDGEGCTSSCYDNDDNNTSDFGVLVRGLVIGSVVVVVLIVGGVGVVFSLRRRSSRGTMTTNVDTKEELTQSPFY
jgi:outer membrane protein assembly factor BamB